MYPHHVPIGIFFIYHTDSPNLENAKKLHNSDAFNPASSSREFYSLLKKGHTLVGRTISFLIPLWGRRGTDR